MDKQMTADDAVALLLPVYRVQQKYGGISGLSRLTGVARQTLWRMANKQLEKEKGGQPDSQPAATVATEDVSEVA
jgi:hypothetical protein